MVEGAPLLREYTSKAYRGFESLPLRHFRPGTAANPALRSPIYGLAGAKDSLANPGRCHESFRPVVAALSDCGISSFLTKRKIQPNAVPRFVSFRQQTSGKRVPEWRPVEVPDCMVTLVLYFQIQKRGGGSSFFWQSTGMGQGTLSFSKKNPDPYETLTGGQK